MKNSTNELTCDEEQHQRFVGHKCHFRYNLDQVKLAEMRLTYRKDEGVFCRTSVQS